MNLFVCFPQDLPYTPLRRLKPNDDDDDDINPFNMIAYASDSDDERLIGKGMFIRIVPCPCTSTPQSMFQFFKRKEKSPFCGDIDTPVLDFW